MGNGIAFAYAYLDGRKPLELSVGLSSTEEMDWSSTISAVRCLETDCQGFKSSNLHGVQSSSNSLISFRVINMWIRDCIENHSICKESATSDKSLPTRLVDLGATKEVLPRICLGRDLPSDTMYVSLSHCWGGISIMRLLKSNLATFQQSMPVDELPKTFRDAMEVCKRLELRYIWIDSLCIIQDSPEDWDYESRRMGDVYSLALFNIAATRAKDGTVGCFARRSLMEVEPCKVYSTWSGLPATSYYCHDFKMPERSLDQAPLLERAWVIQELALAPRIVHFTQTQIFWECLERRACESFPDRIPKNSVIKLGINAAAIKSDLVSHPPHMWRDVLWAKLVQQYTKAKLTFAMKDKYIAISGLARKLIPQDEYVAGHRKSHILHELQWTAEPSMHYGIKRHVDARAPSWSWASIDGPVLLRQLIQEDQSYYVEILEFFIQTATDDPYGPVQRAYLRFKGLLVCLGFSVDVEMTGKHLRLRNGKLDSLKPGDLQTVSLSRLRWNIFLDEGRRQIGEKIYCLPFKLEGTTATGLLLDPTSTKGEYTRSGYFSVSTGDSYRLRLQSWLKMEPISEVERKPANYVNDFQELFKDPSIQIEDTSDLYEQKLGESENGLLQYTFTVV